MPIAEMPQSNKQHAVPQNIMDVEFKLIGDLTMRQFSYLLLFGILAYVCFNVVIGIFKVPLGIICALLGIGLAFVPVGERGMDDWIVAFIRAVNSPTQRIWKKEPEIPFAFSYRSLDVVKQELITLAPTSSRRKLEEYLKYQVGETDRDPLDIPEQEYIMKVRDAFSYLPAQEKPHDNVGLSVGVSVIDEPAVYITPNIPDLSESPNYPANQEKPKEVEEPEENLVKDRLVDIKPTEEKPTEKIQLPVKNFKPGDFSGSSQKQNEISEIKKSSRSSLDIVTSAGGPAQPAPKPKYPVHLLQEGDLTTRQNSNFEMVSITPDMHSGRKFTNLLPSVGELILPIKGERTLRTSDQIKVTDDLKEKTEKLQELLVRIREKENMPSPAKPVVKVQPKPVAEAVRESRYEVKSFQEKNESSDVSAENLRNNIQRSKTIVLEPSHQEEQPNKVKEPKENFLPNYPKPEEKHQDMPSEPKEESKTTPSVVTPVFSPSQNSNIPVITHDPNVVSGIVKDSHGSMLPNILLIIKNNKGEVVRAFKTNMVGQFLLQSPLDNGNYTVEISPSNNLSETFAIISIEVKGDVIPPVEFVGR